MRALLDLIDDDTTLISVNRRLSRALAEAYAQRRVAAGDTAWRTPDVIPFSAWAERTWRAAAAHQSESRESLLRPWQERLLWEQVVRRHSPAAEDSEAPLAAGAAARRAQDAFALINAWQISLEAAEFGFSAESRAFRTWARAFCAQCTDGGWIDPTRAQEALADASRLAAVRPRRRVVFAGFDTLTPQQRASRAALMENGVSVIDADRPRRKGRAAYRSFDDNESELRAAAAWARCRLMEAPDSRLGIVIPELHRMRAMVERIFDEALYPGGAVPGRDAGPRQFNLSYGVPVSRIAVVGDALIALTLCCNRIPLAEAGRLLRSPYIVGGGANLSLRAKADAHLRDTGEPELSLDLLSARAARDDCLQPALRNLLALRNGAPAGRALSFWAGYFSDWLAGLGWPGERPLDSDEHQAVESFTGLLDELAAMAAVTGPVGLDRALSLLQRLADEQLFQPASGPAPVQILGVLETAGLDFDGLWVSGLHDGVWPPPPEPDPFVPISLQREARVPTATPEGQLELAQRRVQDWLCAAERVVMSFPGYDQDEPLRPSPLLAGAKFEQDEGEADAIALDFSTVLNRAGATLESLADERAPPMAEVRVTRGGASMLQDQAACPFRAFARWRLQAKGVPVAASPLDARVRGNLVHAVLSDLWSELRTQEQLNALSSEALDQRIAAAVDRALERERRARPDILRGTFARVERERLCRLIKEWILLEKRRAPFEVTAREREFEAVVGPLTLRVRPDRVDRLQDGAHFVIDYKTGNAEVRKWFGGRPDDPQLAVYTLLLEGDDAGGPVAGAAYGAVKRGALGFKGLADREGVAEGVNTLDQSKVQSAKKVDDWAALKAEWRHTLDALARSFAEGDARVDPKSLHESCAFCDVTPLCRIFERHGPGEEEGGA